MRIILRFAKLEILYIVLSFFILAGWASSSYAASVTVDESDIRSGNQFTGPMPFMITAFAERLSTNPTTFNVLRNTYLFTFFDTGSTSIALKSGDKAFLGLSIPPAKLLDVRINGMGTIDENTLYAPIGPPIGDYPQTQVVNAWVGTSTKNATLIGAPVANVSVAYIDNREASLIPRGPYPDLFPPGTPELEQYVVGPDMSFYTQFSVPAMESIGKKEEVTLRLERFGPVGPTGEGADQGQRYYLRNVVFNDNGTQVSDQGGANLDFFWDSASNFTAITLAMAQSLGLLSQTRDFTCQMADSTQLDGYVIDSVVMTGSFGITYTIENARICVYMSSNPFAGDADARIGSNFFDQVPILFHGPYDVLKILSDIKQGDFDENGVVDCSDYEMLMDEIQRPSQPVHIDGFTRIGWSMELNNIEIQYTADHDMAKIKSVTYDFTGTNAIYDPDWDDNNGDETQIFDLPEDNGTIDDGSMWIVDLDQVSTGTFTPYREDYIGGKVTVEIIDGTTTEAFFNTGDSNDLAQDTLGAAARFSVDIPDFRPPADPIFDLNEDGAVDEADAEMLVGLFDNPGDAPCDNGEEIPGNLDGDVDVDRDDMNIILAARNTPASGPDDPRDLDGDGMITVLDARKLVLMCTRPRCATQ